MFTPQAPPLNFTPESQHVQNTKAYHKTPHGTIFTQSFLPLANNDSKNNISPPVKATIFMTHGYGSDTSWLFEKTCIRFAHYGYAVFAADLIGHGRSDGIPGYIGDMDKAAAASLSFFLSVRRRVEYTELPAFLFGESMGGAISMLMNFQSEPDTWTGLIFSAPLFVCTENTKPSEVHLLMYGLLCGLADTWASMPADKIIVGAVKDINKLKIMLQNPRRYTGRPRVGTKREVARVCNYIQKNFHKITTPFLTVHGTDDGVTCPSGSKMLYEKAASADKSLKLYEGMYHSLIQGEPDENVDIVLGDMRDWLDERVRMYGKKW